MCVGHRREEARVPHPPDAAGKALEGTAVGRDVTEGMPSGRRQRTRKRGDWLEELLREVIRQAVMDRVDPRWDRNAEAHWPTKGSREAGQERMELLNRPTKGDLTLTTARKRRLTKPRGSPFGASRPRAARRGAADGAHPGAQVPLRCCTWAPWPIQKTCDL